MREMRKLRLVLLLVIFCLVSSGFANGIALPPWQPGPTSTLTIWEFLTPDINPIPELELNPFGRAQVTVYPAHPWSPVWGGRGGVWPLSGAMGITIPNNPVENEMKLIQIQMVWATEYPVPTHPVVMVEATKLDGSPVLAEDIKLIGQQVIQLEPTNDPGVGEFWYQSIYLFEIKPNPLFENIYISGSIMVDQVIIDTICIPEPVTIALLGFGSLILIRRKGA